jgi:drug/metabolite transporter (DMT)-like permease
MRMGWFEEDPTMGVLASPVPGTAQTSMNHVATVELQASYSRTASVRRTRPARKLPPSSPLRSHRIGLLCLAVTSFGWGLNWPGMKILLREMPPLLARGSAGLVAALLIAIVAATQGQSLKVPRPLSGRLVAASLTNVFAWMGFATLSIRWLHAGQGALLVYTMPIWATLLAWPILGQRPSMRATAGLLLCIGGLWSLFGGSAMQFDAGQWIGAGFALASAFFFALGTVALRPLVEMPPLALLAWQVGLGCLPMLLLGLAFEDLPHASELSTRGWLLWLYMTAVPMGLCYFTWFAALRRLPRTTASVATLLTLVIGVCASAFMLDEPFRLREVAALLLILSGVALALEIKVGAASRPADE